MITTCAFFFLTPLSRRRPVLYRAPERKVFATPRRRSSDAGDALFVARDAPNRDRAKHESMLLLSAGSRSTPVSASRRNFRRNSRVRGPSLGSADRDPRARAAQRVSLGAAAAFARGRTERGAVAMRAADEPLDAGADVPADARAESRFSRENLDDVSVRKKREKKSDDDDVSEDDDDDDVSEEDDDDDVSEDDDVTPSMSDLEATRALETALGVHMNASAARVIARDFAALGVDTPAKLRRLIVGKSARLLLAQALAVFLNGLVAVSMFLLLKNADSIFLGSTVDAVDAATRSGAVAPYGAVAPWIKPICEVLAFTVGGVFAVESFAHAVIFTTFLANAFVFGFTDLTSFVNAVRALSRDETFSPIPGVRVARDAISAIDATRRLASLRRCVDDAVAKTPETADMTGVQRLGALLELSIAENARGFEPSAFALSESEAMRVASVFAEFDDDADGFVDAAELAALLRSAADSASVEVLDAMEWDPYDATFASDDDELDPGATAMAALDADGDGRVSLEEFVAWWRGGCPLESSSDSTSSDSTIGPVDAADDQDARTIATLSAFSAGD